MLSSISIALRSVFSHSFHLTQDVARDLRSVRWFHVRITENVYHAIQYLWADRRSLFC